jgi:hypothetical protein
MAQGVQAAQQGHLTVQQKGVEQCSTLTSPHCQKIWKMTSSLSCAQWPRQQLQGTLSHSVCMRCWPVPVFSTQAGGSFRQHQAAMQA